MDNFKIFQYRWDIAILAEMHRSQGARLITLHKRCGMSRSVLRTCLARLIAACLVRQNPGYGHPLRPEYILTAAGEAIGPFCASFLKEGERRQISEVFLNKWSCPVMLRTGTEALRFNDLKRQLQPVTSRALSQALKLLHDHSCMAVRLIDSSPPTNLYSLSRKSRGLYRVYLEHQPVIDGMNLL